MKHRTPANPDAGDTFTASINNMMRDDRATCAHAAQALAIFAASGSCPAYWTARQHFANAYAARAQRSFNRFVFTLAALNLIVLAAIILSRRA